MTNFPVKTATGCRLKWTYSTIYLSRASTASCHRVDQDNLTLENFKDFHNLPRKLNDRKLMQQGQWPGGGCEYCKRIEDADGYSDRQLHLTETFDNLTPVALEKDPTALAVVPRILEVYFNNHCNFKCVYCGPWFSSKIAAEMKMHGEFTEKSLTKQFELWQFNPEYKKMLSLLWEYLLEHRHEIKRFQVLGGEPFMQQEFIDTLDFFETNPCPNIELNIVTNLSLTDQKFDYFIQRFKSLLAKKKLESIQITASLDCWGKQSEYIRNGLDLNQWQRNFERLVEIKWIKLQVNHAISVLSIKYMHELLAKMQEWNKTKKIYNNFMTVQGPLYMNPDIFGSELFAEDFEKIEKLMLDDTELTRNTKQYMLGIKSQIAMSQPNAKQINLLKIFLENNDSRRNSDYKVLFPWLVNEFNKVGL
jgi:organic radical activating enzyme